MTLPSRRAPLTLLILPGLLALFALYLLIPWSTASAQQASQEDTCPGADSAPTPTVVEVGAVPIVVESTTDEYFVLYVRHDLDADTTFEVPVGVTLGQDGATTLTESLEALPKERYRVEKYLVSDPADVDGDCTDDITELADPVGMNPVNSVPAMGFDDGAAAIPNRETYVSLAYKSDSGIDSHLRNLEAVKFLMVDMNTDRPSVYFMNTKTYQRHDDFSAAVGLEVNPLHGHETMVAEMVYHPKAVAPDGSLGVYRFQFGANDVYSFKEISYAFTVLAASMPLLEENLAYYPMWEKAVARYHEDQSLYDDSRVDVLLAEDIAFDLDFISLNRGEGFGFLRVMSLEERPNPRDIVIYETLPNDLSRVAGIITTVPQTPLSHVNLRAVQDSVPNSFIRDALEDGDIDGLIGSYVQYLVGSSGYFLRAATPEEVDAHYKASRPSETQTSERDLTVTEITALSDIEFDDWNAFGVKAANVAVLRTLGFPDGTVPDGYAVPFYFYDEFMRHNEFYDDVEEMLADPNFQSDFETQEKELKKLRKKIKKGETPEWIIAALTEMHSKYPEGQSLRYRSSTNNEDLPGFSGAGLYDSKTQHPDETEEDGIAKSLKQVYASLWNFRAFTEREFYRVDHLAAAMGVLVHPNYSDELANGVAVSFDPIRMRYGNYYVNSQLGEDLVTNPDAHSAPEEILLHQGGEYTVLATSNQMQRGQLLMSDAQMDQLRRHLELIHDEFAELYGVEADEPFAMEIEFKITSDDILSIKQARPWVFGDDAPSENSPATGAPTISGTAQVDETLTADVSGITDADGLTSLLYGSLYSYQWIRNDGTTETDISNAASSTYTLSDTDAGKTIRVRVSFTDDRGYEEALTSAPTTAVQPRPNNPATGAPTISGTAQVGETLAAAISGIADADGLTSVSYSYQWIANDASADTDISGQTGSTYTLVSADKGKTIKVRVDFTDDRDHEEYLVSAATTAVQPRPNSPATGGPTINGTAQVDETLTADTSGIADEDGLDNATFSYQWIRSDGNNDTDISGQTGSTYTLASADKGKTINVRVSFTDDADNEETLTSAATAAVTPQPDNMVSDEDPAVWSADMLVVDLGNGSIGAVSANLFSNQGGSAGLQAKWLWYYTPGRYIRLAFPDVVPGGEELTLEIGDVVLTLQAGDSAFTWDDVDVDWEDGQIIPLRIVPTSATAVSQPNSPATGAPTISGAAQEDETLTVDTSRIADADGLENVSYSYQWIRNDESNDSDIPDATGTTYTLDANDVGKTIKVRVSFTDNADHEETLTSAATTAVAARPNTPATGLPTIAGTAQVGETLTADTSDIADADGLDNATFSYQWIRNDGNSDSDIPDATDTTYTLVSADEGKTIKVRATFTDDADNEETLTSATTEVVQRGSNAWSATMTVGARDGYTGYSFWGDPHLGSLSVTEVEWDGKTHHVRYIFLQDGKFLLGLNEEMLSTGFVLSVGDEEFGSADAMVDKGGASYRFRWDDPGLGWSDGDEVSVNLVQSDQNTPALGAPTISGTAQVDETLTADTSGVEDADGLDNVSYSYQWMADGADIQNATSSTYKLVFPDQGKTIKVRVTFTDDRDNAETLTSAATVAVAVAANRQATGQPTTSGTPQVGETLTADTSGIADEDGLDNVSYGYQWIRSDGDTDTEIAGETFSTYTVADDDVGKHVKVRVAFIDDAGNEESLTSGTTEVLVDYDADNDGLIEVTTLKQLDAIRHDLDGDGIPTDDGVAAYTAAFPGPVERMGCSGADGCAGYEIMADLDFDTNGSGDDDAGDTYWNDGAGWTPIGGGASQISSTGWTMHNPFLAIFEGNGRTISNLFVDKRGSFLGLFGYVGFDAASGAIGVIRNVNLIDVNVTGGHDGSGLAAVNLGVITNSQVTGLVTGVNIIGGLVGENYGVIAGSHVAGCVSGGTMVGGLVGRSYGAITNSSVTGCVSALSYVGGLVGNNYGLITGSHTAGRVSGHGVVIGGLVGSHKGAITASRSTARVLGTDSGPQSNIIGGLVGDNRGAIAASYATGHVSGEGWIGGLVGQSASVAESPSAITASYATGRVSGTRKIGGLVGVNDGAITASYAAGPVSGSEDVGGLAGTSGGVITASYWDTRTSGHPAGSHGVGKTTAELQAPTGYSGIYETWNLNGDDVPDSPWDLGSATQHLALAAGLEMDTDDVLDSLWDLGAASQYPALAADLDGAGRATWQEFGHQLRAGPVLTTTVTPGEDSVELSWTAVNTSHWSPVPTVTYTLYRGDGDTVEAIVRDLEGLVHTDGDVTSGETYSYQVVAVVAGGEAAYSALDSATPGVNAPATGAPTIAGTAQVGETLTADTSDIADADGLDNATFSYQWIRNDGNSDSDIPDATDTTYTLVSADEGKTIKVRATFTDDADNEETLTSATTEVVQRGSNAWSATMTVGARDGYTGYSFWGDPHLGSLSVTEVEWDGKTHHVRYIFLQDGKFLLGLNEEMLSTGFVLSVGDEEFGSADAMVDKGGASYRFRWDDPGLGWSDGDEVSVNLVQSDQNTPALGAPTISGTAQVDETLTADTSGVEDADGLDNVSYSYQWMADGADIQNATSSTYKLVFPDQGKTIKVRVTFTDDRDNAETLTSAATVAVAVAANRQATGQPTTSGTPQVGETLTADTSGIADEDGLDNVSYGYQWIVGGSDIDGATGSSYTLIDSEQGKTIQVRVAFTDDRNNEETLTSIATAAVAPAPVPLTVSVTVSAPATHDGSSELTFEIEFSEEIGISYRTLKSHAFTVTGGSVEKAQRTDKPSNIPWRITVKPHGNGDVTIELPATTDCNADGAICTGDGRKLSNSLSFTVSGPGG